MKYLSLFVVIILSNLGYAQGFYDLQTIQTIEIEFAQSNWDALMDAEKAGDENYIMAQSVTINGVVFDSVGVKYKGNSTYSANQIKNPLHIELNTYKDHIYEAYTDIKLSNVAKDPSFLREVLSYQILRQYMKAPLSNYANVYINGDLMGLYSNSESISKKFTNKYFYSKDNTFVKCNPPDGAGPQSNDLPNLTYLGEDSANYADAYELKSDTGWHELIDLCDTLNNQINEIEQILDVDRALWMIAFDNMLVNLDSYIGGFAQNYYLYRDHNGRFNPVVWDLNESFGQFSMTGSISLNSTAAKQQMTHLLHENDSDYPLISKLLSIPMYKRMYLAHCKTILEENFDNGSYVTTAQTFQTLVDASVQSDPNKFYTYANFNSNLNSDVSSGGGPGGSTTPGITNLMNARSTHLLGLADFTNTQPTISQIALSNSSPALNETVTLTATLTDETTVYLGHRDAITKAFERVLMYDDGAHNDGAANDGVYGVDITITSSEVQYYIYAENTNAGKFSPARAEHEYHTISASNALGGVVINEFLAANDSSAFDQDGEYDDWIELYNNSNSSIDLSGYFLTDDVSDLSQWTFPSGASIPANGYLIIWADEDETQTGLHANFKLSSSGESVILSDASGSIIDLINYTNQSTDISFGRFPNGTGSFQLMTPTHGSQNWETLGIAQSTSQSDFIITAYPNPANDYLEIQFSNSGQKMTSIYDLQGSLVFQTSIQGNKRIDTSSWSAGMYIIKVENYYLKIVVQ